MEVAELLGVYEVDEADRVVCQALGCGRSVHKRIHFIRLAGALSVLGSDCYRRLQVQSGSRSSGPRYGIAEGRRLTDEERALLQSNTVLFIERLEAEAVAEEVERQRLSEAARATASVESQPLRPGLIGARWPHHAPPSRNVPRDALAGHSAEELRAAEALVKKEMHAQGIDPELPGWRGLVRDRVEKVLRGKFSPIVSGWEST